MSRYIFKCIKDVAKIPPEMITETGCRFGKQVTAFYIRKNKLLSCNCASGTRYACNQNDRTAKK